MWLLGSLCYLLIGLRTAKFYVQNSVNKDMLAFDAFIVLVVWPIFFLIGLWSGLVERWNKS